MPGTCQTLVCMQGGGVGDDECIRQGSQRSVSGVVSQPPSARFSDKGSLTGPGLAKYTGLTCQ